MYSESGKEAGEERGGKGVVREDISPDRPFSRLRYDVSVFVYQCRCCCECAGEAGSGISPLLDGITSATELNVRGSPKVNAGSKNISGTDVRGGRARPGRVAREASACRSKSPSRELPDVLSPMRSAPDLPSCAFL